jgi:type IV pilus assembly protein PilQ
MKYRYLQLLLLTVMLAMGASRLGLAQDQVIEVGSTGGGATAIVLTTDAGAMTDNKQAPVNVPVAPDTAPVAEVPVAAPVPDPVPTEIFDFNDVEIQTVLRSLAAQASLNLIMGDQIIGKVTVHLENVTHEDALRLIAESKGYAFLKDKNVIQIKTRDALQAAPLEMRVFTLNYAKAEEVKKTIEPVVSGRGKVQVDARSNVLIVSDTTESLEKIVPLVATLDTQTPQVMIEAKFVETTKNPKKDLGLNWSDTLLNHEFTAGEFNWSGNPGIGWTPATALLDVGSAKVVFSYLSRDADTELLANPRVVTTDNQKARISIATQFPIPEFSFSEQTASLQISGFEYKDIGIILNVLPRINKNEFITLEVSPEASSTTESATLQSGGGSAVEIPIVNTRTATTTVLIKSGNTLAIGGLMRQDTSDSYTKVPVLGDLPLLGSLFRSKSLDKSKRDLLIFLTPTIVQPDQQTGYEKYYNGFPAEEVYANDKWMPKDNAKPRDLVKTAPRTEDVAKEPSAQNFEPKNTAAE